MKPYLLLIGCLLFAPLFSFSQKYYTKTGTISFEAGTALEDIDAVNKSAASVLDAATGQLEIAVLVKGFEFRRALMQQHFNENYMESSKYPKATFKGTITNMQAINLKKDGTYTATVKGILEMHGQKKEQTTTATFKVSGQSIKAASTFIVNTSDYKIAIPGVVKDKISSTVKINANINYLLLK